MDFSELIRSRREQLGFTLEDVARYVGVKKSTILRWENGEINNPRRDRIALLAAVLQLPPVALIKESCGLPEDYPIKKEAADLLIAPAPKKAHSEVEALIDSLMQLPPNMLKQVLDLVSLPPAQLQRVLDFASGLRAAGSE